MKTEIDNFINEYGSDEENEIDESMILEVQQFIDEATPTNTVVSSTNDTAGLQDGDFLLGANTATAQDDVAAVNNA